MAKNDKKLIWDLLLLISALYLLNFTLGIIEIIPDNLPIIGNLDEFVSTILFLYGIERSHFAPPFRNFQINVSTYRNDE